MSYMGSKEKVHQRIYYDGTILWMIPLVSQVTCEMQIIKFPFDTQECGLKLYTWAHDANEMYIYHPDPVMTDYYSQNGEWDYQGSSIFTANITDESMVFTKLTINLHFRRKWLFLGLSMIIPAVLNSLLMCAVFALSFESGEKLGYALTVLLTYIVLLTLVADSLPPISTDISVLQIYLTGVMCLGTIATLLTVLTVSTYNQDPDKPRPQWLISLCRYILAPLACRTGCWKVCKNDLHTTRERSASSRPKIQPMEMSTLSDSQTSSNGLPPANTRGLMFNMGRTHSMLSQNGVRASQRTIENMGTSPALVQNGYRYTNRTNHGDFRGPSGTVENPRDRQTISRESNQTPRYTNSERYAASDDGDSRNTEVDYTWKEVAELMDSAFLRMISFVIGVGTIAVLVFFIIVY